MARVATLEKNMTTGEAGTALALALTAFLCAIVAGKAETAGYAFHASLLAIAALAGTVAVLNNYLARPAALPPPTIEGRPNYNFGPVKFATVMAKCPKNRAKYAHFKGLSIREMAELNAKHKNSIPTLSSTAVGSLVSEVTNLWVRATAGVADVKDLKSYRITMPASARKAIIREGLPVSSLNVWLKAAASLYPRSVHCSHANLSTVPLPLPPSAEYLCVLFDWKREDV